MKDKVGISIAERFRPYSHEFGESCLLPRTCWIVQAFPTLIRLRLNTKVVELSLSLRGPIREFTFQQDLEKGCLFIWGIAKEGRFRLRLEANKETIELYAEKAPSQGLLLLINDGEKSQSSLLRQSQSLFLHETGLYLEPLLLTRLSFGMHRAQDWSQISKRFELEEILPLAFHLSQWIPCLPIKRELSMGLEEFFRAGFSSLLVPRLKDTDHQGLVDLPKNLDIHSPLELIGILKLYVQSLFIKEEGNGVLSLDLPRDFLCGRMTHIPFVNGTILALEWMKRKYKKVVISVKEDCQLRLILSKPTSSFRLRSSFQEKGMRVEVGAILNAKAEQVYYLDKIE